MMNDELERIWREMLVAERSYHLAICLGEIRNVTKTSVRAVGVPTAIPTDDLPITSQERYRYDDSVGKSDFSVTINWYVCHDVGGALCYKSED
jgi:hypothetical protein